MTEQTGQSSKSIESFGAAILIFCFSYFMFSLLGDLPWLITFFLFCVLVYVVYLTPETEKDKSDLTTFFWISWVVVGNGVLYINHLLMEKYQSKLIWILIVPTLYSIFSSKLTLEKCNDYEVKKKKEGKGYGWSIFVKVCLALNFFLYCIIWFGVLTL